jgi:hypothetical protein
MSSYLFLSHCYKCFYTKAEQRRRKNHNIAYRLPFTLQGGGGTTKLDAVGLLECFRRPFYEEGAGCNVAQEPEEDVDIQEKKMQV